MHVAANCGETGDLLKCSRCHIEWFCSVKCQKVISFRLSSGLLWPPISSTSSQKFKLSHAILQKDSLKLAFVILQAYWPFHKANCQRNEFADLTETSEPKFSRWMRKHQKLAVLKDDEIDRLERASAACTGPSRQEVMDSMYNRLDPRPKGALLKVIYSYESPQRSSCN